MGLASLFIKKRDPHTPIEKKVTNGSARVGISDEWPVEPTDHWIIPVQSRSEYKVSLPSSSGWDLLDEILERPARPPTVFSEGARHPHGPQKHP